MQTYNVTSILLQAYTHADMQANKHTNTQHTQTYKHVSIQTNQQTDRHTYIHTCKDTNAQAHKHTSTHFLFELQLLTLSPDAANAKQGENDKY